jgi:hypothetical protein
MHIQASPRDRRSASQAVAANILDEYYSVVRLCDTVRIAGHFKSADK